METEMLVSWIPGLVTINMGCFIKLLYHYWEMHLWNCVSNCHSLHRQFIALCMHNVTLLIICSSLCGLMPLSCASITVWFKTKGLPHFVNKDWW